MAFFGRTLVDIGHTFRHNPAGAVSGPQLGEAAHRLVANSLQVKADRNGFNDQMYIPPPTHYFPHGPPNVPFQKDRHQGQEPTLQQYTTGYSAQVSVRSHYDHSYRQPYTYPAAHNYQSRSHSHNERSDRSVNGSRIYQSRSHSHNERNDRPVNGSREYPQHGYYQAGLHQSGGFGYPMHPQHVGRAPLPPGATFYGSYESFQPYEAGNYNHWGGGWARQVDPNVGREYRHPRHSGNQFSALDRGSHRRPPISEHPR
mgnify:CR=1 FL=1